MNLAERPGLSARLMIPEPLPVSVIIPAYNAERFIREALASVLSQTARPAEIIVVDDGSTDRTAEIARSMGATLLQHGRNGVSLSRNLGILAATSEWVALLDADDLWEAEKLEMQWLALQACPSADLTFTDFSQGLPGQIQIPSLLGSRPNYQRITRREVAPGIVECDGPSFLAGFFEGNFILPSTALLRRSLAIDAGLFDPELSHVEDREFFLRVLRKAHVAVVERCLVRRRIHETSASEDTIRMSLGIVQVADRVFAHPDRYPIGAVAAYRREKPIALRRAGLHLLEAGRRKEARAALLGSLRGRFKLSTLAAYVLAFSPSPAFYNWIRALRGWPNQERSASDFRPTK